MSDTVDIPTNPLEVITNAKARAALYISFGAIGLILGAVAVALLVAGIEPKWYLISTAVYNFLQPYFATLATKHINKITT